MLTAAQQAAGFPYRLSILQMEVSRTQVFDRPVRGREFFEEIIRDNLDLGRPSRVQLLFTRRITRATPGRFQTRVVTHGVAPSVRQASALPPQRSLRQLSQHGRIPFAVDEGAQHRLTRGAEDIGHHHAQFDVGCLQEFVDAIGLTCALPDQCRPIARQVPKLADGAAVE
jgi:hypothetical protein